MSLMDQIKDYPIDPEAIGIWWLGQMGLLFKTADGHTLVVDPYLTDSAGEMSKQLPVDLSRIVPTELEPEDLDVDIFVSTHAHMDHADPETIRRTPKGSATFIGPALDTPVVVYCMTNHMATIAGDALLELGYCDVRYLDGGMRGWTGAGYPLLP